MMNDVILGDWNSSVDMLTYLSVIQGITEPGTDPYTQVKQMDKRRAEPEKIRIWREEQTEMLKKKGILYFVLVLNDCEW